MMYPSPVMYPAAMARTYTATRNTLTMPPCCWSGCFYADGWKMQVGRQGPVAGRLFIPGNVLKGKLNDPCRLSFSIRQLEPLEHDQRTRLVEPYEYLLHSLRVDMKRLI